MQETFEQIGNLLLDAVPTILLFIVLVIAYRWLIDGPLTQVFKKRRALTVGAVEDAQRAIAQAEARAAEYAERLRHARNEAFRAREHRLHERNAECEAALDAARKAATAKVEEARAELETEAERARTAIQVSAAELAGQVVRAVLPQPAGGPR
jgi:F-type H+-transporting ATPase subunit b